jgi:hypothetical protein
MALSENNGLPSFNVLLQSQSYVTDLEARLRHTQHTCRRFQYKLHNVQAALQRELQCRVIFQQQVQKHSETIQLYKMALQEASNNLQQERGITEMQKKVISDQEDLIGIYQAGYQLVEAQSEIAFTSGAVNATLPAMRSEENIAAGTSANPGGPQKFSKGALFPVIDSNSYSFSYVTDPSSGPKPASTSEMASLTVETKPSGSSVVRKGATASLPRTDYEDHADCDFVMPDFQFPTSSLRDTPCVAGISEHNDHWCYDHDKGANPIVSDGLGSKRATKEEKGGGT